MYDLRPRRIIHMRKYLHNNSFSIQVVVMACREFEMGRVSCNWQCVRGNVVSHCALKKTFLLTTSFLPQKGEAMHQAWHFLQLLFYIFFFILSFHPFTTFVMVTALFSYSAEQMHLKGAIEIECCISSLFQKKCERYWPESKEDVFVCEPFNIHYVRDISSLTHTTLPVLVFYFALRHMPVQAWFSVFI